MKREDAVTVIKSMVGNYLKCSNKTYTDSEVCEAIDVLYDTLDQLKKARKAARRYKRMYLELKAEVGNVQCKD